MNGADSDKIVLLREAQKGDEKAFEQLVKACYSSLYRTVFQMVPNGADVEEILQETFYRFFLSLKKVRETDPTPYLRQIAIRRTYTFLGKRRAEISLDDLPENVPELIIEGRGFDVRDLYGFSSKLPPKRRIIFLLREVLGFDDAEISRELGISEVTVRRHAQMAKEEMRKQIP
ncbi:MAG TPA: RNA polymerase sigma factor [Acidobacteriota bacterium]|jgi:RNA polymerase sigma-70 factor (ECF subfamily)|nr:RNA polymerase sigma factor [Acidobacteriota bacterium]HNT17307.1 RNA polymerase sigma factor [Acidobacteriota bacterium]HPA26370.1 RNA polymerase sigma factor [Acidobacteriota bacterium]HQO19734.1 RNA polymerase sigma factor [Acidobacteriota bacterium]HQQ46352.1 RNA polymerase sigma factor [Acidobacteriota bacterium]